MSTVIVQKYGGSSVADPVRLKAVAQRIADTCAQGHKVVAVVSAMGDTTDELLALAGKITDRPPRRELDMLLTTGERITTSLLAMALAELGIEAISFTGSQCGILTNDTHSGARIVEVRPYRVEDELARGRVVIVAGYQGVSYRREVTTLGRGGTDTTAVALAAALGAEYCEICSDVDGVYSADPRVVPDAQRLEQLSCEETQVLAEAGAKVLHAAAVEYARRHRIAIWARKTATPASSVGDGTMVRVDPPTAPPTITGVAAREALRLSTPGGAQALGRLAAWLSGEGLDAKWLQWPGGEAPVVAYLFSEDVHGAQGVRERFLAAFGSEARFEAGVSVVSAVGSAVDADPSVTQAFLEEAGAAGAALGAFERTSLRLSVVVPAAAVAELLRRLHGRLVEGERL